jgi:hypothetical protein
LEGCVVGRFNHRIIVCIGRDPAGQFILSFEKSSNHSLISLLHYFCATTLSASLWAPLYISKSEGELFEI